VTISYQDAVAEITGPGQRYETHQIDVDGITYTAFKGAPAHLRELFDLTSLYGDAEFLVYEDERYTFTETHANGAAVAAALDALSLAHWTIGRVAPAAGDAPRMRIG